MEETEIRSYYQTRLKPEPARGEVWKKITNYLLPYFGLHKNADVLELGCGYGYWIGAVPARNRFALDVNPDIDNVLKQSDVIGVKTYVGSCSNLEMFSDQTLDLVLASNLLEHLELDEVFNTLNEVLRTLKKNGRFCLIQPNFALCPRQYFDDYTHRSIFTAVSLKEMLEAHNFQILYRWNRFLPFTMRGSNIRLVSFLPAYLRSPWKPFAGQMCMIAQPKK